MLTGRVSGDEAAGGGKMINIGSMMSLFGAPYATPYAASKGGIVQMTRAMATAWAKDNIQVNAVLPGWIDTDLTQRARQQVDGLHERVEDAHPGRPLGHAGDMAGIAAFLASPASDFVTGSGDPGGWRVFGRDVIVTCPARGRGRDASAAKRRAGARRLCVRCLTLELHSLSAKSGSCLSTSPPERSLHRLVPRPSVRPRPPASRVQSASPPNCAQIVRTLPIADRQPRRIRRAQRRGFDVRGRTTGTSSMSAWNCISSSFATMPPSTRSVLIGNARILLHRLAPHRSVWYAVASSAARAIWPAVA